MALVVAVLTVIAVVESGVVAVAAATCTPVTGPTPSVSSLADESNEGIVRERPRADRPAQ